VHDGPVLPVAADRRTMLMIAAAAAADADAAPVAVKTSVVYAWRGGSQ